MGSAEHMAEGPAECFITVCLFLSLFILTWVGVGDTAVVSMLGFLLCAVGIVQGPARVDLRALVLLLLYNLLSMASSCAAYGNPAVGYASTQMIYPVLYLVMSYNDEGQTRLLRRLCVLWAAVAAASGLCQFTYNAAAGGGAGRLSGFLGNPNAMGIFLAVGWFVLQACTEQRERDRLSALLSLAEPILLAALALTLSMGSFLAMAAGTAVLFLGKKRGTSFAEMLRYAGGILAKTVLGAGVGVLLYLAGTRTDAPWMCVPLLLYLLALAVCWGKLGAFLEAYPRMAAGLALSGVLLAVAVVLVRPSSLATFAERLEMMRSGAGYLLVNPLLGAGSYRWRFLDMYDGGIYFNTWHIHNALLHVGVELGLPAMAVLAAVAVRFLCKKKIPAQRAGFAAFFVHNLMDTSFFYLCITALLLLTAGSPREGAGTLGRGFVRGLFGALALFFVYNLYYSVTV